MSTAWDRGTVPASPSSPARPRVWPVGALCLAMGDALQARFGTVAVEGELSGLTQAGSGHWYFTLKDAQGQLRCAMFRRAASALDFTPREGDHVIAHGRLGVYAARGDLQMVVEAMRRAGQGNLYEQFLQLKNALQQEGLFDTARKRPPVAVPRGVGLVTSPNAAALHDVISALRRRAPHVPVLLVPALVQGAQAPASLRSALHTLYQRSQAADAPWPIDTILLVRGGGSIEDLWAFNDPALARLIVRSPVPLIAGIGHESDFTIADLCADVRAPTPTAAAELAAVPQEQALAACARLHERLAQAVDWQWQRHAQRLHHAAHTLARPSALWARHQARLEQLALRLHQYTDWQLQQQQARLQAQATRWDASWHNHWQRQHQRLEQAQLRLHMLDPQRVLERGYAILTTASGQTVRDAAQVRPGQTLRARLAQGHLDVQALGQQASLWPTDPAAHAPSPESPERPAPPGDADLLADPLDPQPSKR